MKSITRYFVLLLIILVFFLSLNNLASGATSTQNIENTIPSIVWVKTYGQAGDDEGLSIAAVGNDGYIIGGGTETSVTHLDDSWLKRIDNNGVTRWTQHTVPLILDDAHTIVPTSDGGFIISGCTEPFGEHGPENAAIIKMDGAGNFVWNDSPLKNLNEVAYAAFENSKGMYIFTGHTTNTDYSVINPILGLIDKNGKILWVKTLTSDKPTDSQSIVETPDGGYILAGYRDVTGNGNIDAWVAKVNNVGELQWEKTYGGGKTDSAHKIIAGGEGKYIIVGETDSQGSGSKDVWIFSINPDGKLLWQKTYGGKNDDRGFSLTQTQDGGYLIAATTASYGAGKTDAWLIKIDPEGNAQWSKTVGGVNDDNANSVIEDGKGEYLLIGNTDSYGAGDFDAWVVELK